MASSCSAAVRRFSNLILPWLGQGIMNFQWDGMGNVYSRVDLQLLCDQTVSVVLFLLEFQFSHFVPELWNSLNSLKRRLPSFAVLSEMIALILFGSRRAWNVNWQDQGGECGEVFYMKGKVWWWLCLFLREGGGSSFLFIGSNCFDLRW